MVGSGKKLAKNIAERKLSGVCSGIADYFVVDANVIRLIWVLAAVFTGGAAVLGYIAAALLLPVREQDAFLGRQTSVLSVVFVVILVGAVLSFLM